MNHSDSDWRRTWVNLKDAAGFRDRLRRGPPPFLRLHIVIWNEFVKNQAISTHVCAVYGATLTQRGRIPTTHFKKAVKSEKLTNMTNIDKMLILPVLRVVTRGPRKWWKGMYNSLETGMLYLYSGTGRVLKTSISKFSDQQSSIIRLTNQRLL